MDMVMDLLVLLARSDKVLDRVVDFFAFPDLPCYEFDFFRYEPGPEGDDEVFS